MTVTVADCLKLSSLREAAVVAGHKGLHKTVGSISVLEYADMQALEDAQFYLGNEMVISAFVSVKDDVEAQYTVMQRLHDMGVVCLVLYYVGVFLPAIDKRLIKLADELDFPLVMMPPDCFVHRYSDMISEVMNAIIKDQWQETNIVSSILEQVAQLNPYRRNISAVMRILSDRLRCPLLLVDRQRNRHAFAPWPFASSWEESDLEKVIEASYAKTKFDEPAEVEINGRKKNVFSVTLDTEKQKGLLLLAVDESGNIDSTIIMQAVEALQLFANIWKDDFLSEGPDALVRAILNNQPGEMRRVARQLCINTEKIETMWLLWEKESKANGTDKKNQREWLATRITGFLKENYYTLLVDVYKQYVVAFMGAPCYAYLETQMGKQFMDEIAENAPDWILFSCNHLQTTEDVRAAYLLMEDNKDYVCKIFPQQNIFTPSELLFAQRCRDIFQNSEGDLEKSLKILNPLLQDENGRETIDTLATLLLDCQSSVTETAQKLFVHKNTVKYRINKAKSILGFDVLKTPEMLALYLALALDRVYSE